MNDQELTGLIIKCAIEVHKELGPGLLESAYKESLHFLLIKYRLRVEKEKPFPLIFQQIKLDCGYRVDLLVEEKITLEIKAVDCLSPVHLAQVLTYLKLSKLRVGYLINFNVCRLTDGLKRVVNGY
ncbi:MAG: GxxExxY protein [Bacteroidetes bacterium]|nr:MAG: GxxExxY protein [Bacteroidota bacterium]